MAWKAGTVTARRAVELKAGPLVVLARRRRVLAGLLAGGLLLGGLLATGVLGLVLLLLVATLLGLLLFLSWPLLPPAARAVRVLTLGLVVASAVAKVT